MITWLQYNGNIMRQLQWITIILKHFEVLRYAVHFRYSMLCCSIYLGKNKICIIHIIFLLLCIAYITLMYRKLRCWSASLFFCVLPENRRKKWSVSKEHFVQDTRQQIDADIWESTRKQWDNSGQPEWLYGPHTPAV